MSSINDKAARARLSTATISRHLKRRPYVSKEAQRSIDLAFVSPGIDQT